MERLPSLLERRESHACGTYHHGDNNVSIVTCGVLIIIVTYFQIKIVAGGLDPDSRKYLSSTEWLIAGVSDHWTRGNPLPRAMGYMAFTSTETQMFILGMYWLVSTFHTLYCRRMGW